MYRFYFLNKPWIISEKKKKGPPLGKGWGEAKHPRLLAAGLPTDLSNNPGLLESEQIYTGFVKSSVNPTSGYGFIEDEMIAQLYQGKDAFLHKKYCPWAADMDLRIGEAVLFNLLEDEQGNPQVKRIVRAT